MSIFPLRELASLTVHVNVFKSVNGHFQKLFLHSLPDVSYKNLFIALQFTAKKFCVINTIYRRTMIENEVAMNKAEALTITKNKNLCGYSKNQKIAVTA